MWLLWKPPAVIETTAYQPTTGPALVDFARAAVPAGFLIALVAAAVWWHEIENRLLKPAGTAVLVAFSIGCAWYYLGSM